MKSGQSHKPLKKLVLNKETLKKLSESDLAWAQGGMMPVSGDDGKGCGSYDINGCGNTTG